MAKIRSVSKLMRDGAAMLTRPVGGCTLRWTFLNVLADHVHRQPT